MPNLIDKTYLKFCCFDFVVPPSITGFFGNQTKNESDSAYLICNATGVPAPNITLTRLPENTIVNSSFTISGKQDEGTYRCTADNGVGNAATADVFIIVPSKCIQYF